MKKIFTSLLVALSLLAAPAHATVWVMNNNIVWGDDNSDISTALAGYCDTGNLFYNRATHKLSIMQDCGGSPFLVNALPVAAADVAGLSTLNSAKLDVPSGTTSQYVRGDGSLASFPTSLSSFTNGPGYITSSSLSPYLTSSAAAAAYFPIPTGTTSQYVRGDGTLATLPSSSSRTFNYPSRALNSCFQVSSTLDADVNYSVNISATITLGGGTGVLTTYTNSGCSTGTQVVANGAVSSVAVLGTSSIPLHAIIPAGKWAKVTGTASGGGSAAIDSVQAETTLP